MFVDKAINTVIKDIYRVALSDKYILRDNNEIDEITKTMLIDDAEKIADFCYLIMEAVKND